MLSLQSARESPPVSDCIIWRPVYRFAIQICLQPSVWCEFSLEVILKQIAILILILMLMFLLIDILIAVSLSVFHNYYKIYLFLGLWYLKALANVRHNLRELLNVCMFPHYFFTYILRNKCDMRLKIF